MRLPAQYHGHVAPVPYNGAAEVPLWAPPPPEPDFLDGLRKIWRHRRTVAVCTVLFAGASVLVARWLPTYYTASAEIQVGVPDVQIFPGDPRFMPGAPNDAAVENERIAMLSRNLIGEVVDRLNLARDPRFNPAIADKDQHWFERLFSLHGFSSANSALLPNSKSPAPPPSPAVTDKVIDNVLAHFDVSVLGRSQVLNVSAWSRSPALSAALVNALVGVYLKHEKNEKVDESNRVESYLENRIAQLQSQVDKSEEAVAAYRKEYGLFNGTNASVASQQLTELNTQLIDAQTAKAEADSKLSEALALRSQGARNSLSEVLNSPVIQVLDEQEATAEQRLAQLSQSYGPRHPKILDARAAVAKIKSKIALETDRVIDGLRNQARAADARYGALKKNFSQQTGQMGVVSEKNVKLDALERDATVNSKLLAAMLGRAKQIFGRNEIDQPGARMLSPAAPPELPSYPPRMLIVLLGSVGGLLIGGLVALLRDSIDRTWRRAEEVEQATGIPVLSMVPNLRGSPPPVAQVLRTPFSTYNEALRKIFVGLQLFVKGDAPPKTVLFSSAMPAEGKSVLAASLARLLALNGKRVLLIDCDWRNPAVHRLFQCSNRNGLAQLICGEDATFRDVIYNDPLSGLDVLVSGEWTPQSSDMLTSERLVAMLRTFSKNYDLVILDSAPVLISSDVLVLSRLVDKTIFAVRWGHTRREVALDALRQLIDAQADVAGIVMSRVDTRRYRDFAYGNLNYDYGPTMARVA